MNPTLQRVTLIVYGWTSVAPGTLSWVFPNVESAVHGAAAMRNAARWAIVPGERPSPTEVDVDEERKSGAILIEKT
ncbi:MAG: hypothetical protein U0169_10195 [Polyangiaceae bacterium]